MNDKWSPGTPLRVLLLEDDPDDAMLLQAFLVQEGFALRVTLVETRADFELHLSPEFDVILSDHGLPQFNALQALEMLSARGLDVPFIIVSGAILEEAAVEAMRLGAADYLLKDRIARLGQAVWNAIVQRRNRQDKAQAQESIRQQEALNRAVLSSLDANIAVVDATGRIVSVNDAWERFAEENGVLEPSCTGVGSNYLLVCQAAFEAGNLLGGQAMEGLRAVIEGRAARFTMEYPCHSPDEQRWFEMRILPLMGAGGDRAVVSHHNITSRKRAQESDRQLASILSQSNDAIVTLSPGGIIQSWNSGAEHLYGYSAAEAIGQSTFDLTVPSGHREEFTTLMAKACSQDRIEHLDAIRTTKDRRAICISLSMSSLHDSDGQVLSISTIERDISEQKRYEQGLIDAREQAEDMNRLKNTFLNNMSHEIRTPLTGIIGCADLLFESLQGEDREFAKMIQTSGQRLLESLNAILEMASLERGQLPLVIGPVNLAEPLDRALSHLQLHLSEKRLDMQICKPADAIYVNADADALQRVFVHVLSNAIKFTKQGRITVSFDASDGQGHVHIADTGIGIGRDFLPHVFKEFKQESAGLGRNFEGSGLGMAISKRLTTLMGGDIWVSSERGSGSTFTLALPLAAVAEENHA